MKRTIHILMLAVVAMSFCRVAVGETMAERKQRIMRKYLRERQDVVQSDILIPVALEDVEQVVDSEKYKTSVDLTRSRNSMPPPAAMVRPMPVQVQNNWMFNQDDSEFDPNADPFADDTLEDVSGNRNDWLAEWRKKQSERAAKVEAGAAGGYNSMGYRNSYSPDQGSSGYSSQRDSYSGYTPYGSQPNGGYYSQSDGSRIGPYGTGSYGSTPSGLLQYPNSPLRPSKSKDSSTTASGYTPYQSPYQRQKEQQRQQSTPQTQQEFTRPTPYKQWKDNNNKRWDPTADDAYLDQLMRRDNR